MEIDDKKEERRRQAAKLGVKALKAALNELGVSTKGCTEKR